MQLTHHDDTIELRSVTVLVTVCVVAMAISLIMSLRVGDFSLSLDQILQALKTPNDDTPSFVVWQLRLPRAVLGLMVGAVLGMAGAIVQSITRNPLGSPSLMGVTSGAAFAIVIGLVVFDISYGQRLSVGTVGGLSAAALTFGIAWQTRLNPVYLTLAGMSVALFFAAGISVLLIASDGEAMGLYVWLTGSLGDRTWQHVGQLAPFALLGLVMGVSFARALDLLMLDDDTATSLGVSIHRWRLLLGMTAVILTAATVSVAGPISFIGLIAPHIVRLGLRGDGLRGLGGQLPHRWLLPLSALVGASLIGIADLIAKVQDVPVGIFCVLLGGPLFVYLIGKQPC
ncbi:MAG TPA: iron ABC transporter permease [Gammaproteobacteria bacterium]|jgi:iron complex transport system permease protein|nr:iron ABC transporter permease [Gammaproteobacteria bacterium]